MKKNRTRRYAPTVAVGRRHTVQPPSEWDREMERWADHSIALRPSPTVRRGHKKNMGVFRSYEKHLTDQRKRGFWCKVTWCRTTCVTTKYG